MRRWPLLSAAMACLNPILAVCWANFTHLMTTAATGGFSLLYAAGNIGSIAAPIACGLAAQWYGWHVGFALAGVGMFIGLLIFLSGHRHFQQTRGVNRPALRAVKFALPTWGWLVLMLCIAPVFFTLLLENNWSGYVLAIVCVFAAQLIARIMVKFPEHRRALWQIVLLMITGTLFWVLAQQGGSSISLFIDRFVNRHWLHMTVPTALFQSVNAIAVMAAGVMLAWLSSPKESAHSVLRVWLKFVVGLVLMSGGFMLLALNAHQARLDGQASMGMMIAGLALMGFAELFIDPVAMAQITRLNLPGVTGVLTGIYMLATGAVANWLAGVVAQQTTESQISDTAVAAYGHFFLANGRVDAKLRGADRRHCRPEMALHSDHAGATAGRLNGGSLPAGRRRAANRHIR